MICSDMCLISATRQRLSDEITPVSVEHSGTKDDDEECCAAAHATDLELRTRSFTIPGSDGNAWLKVNLAKLNCIHQVIKYVSNGKLYLIWTCTSSDCSTCRSYYCNDYLLTTSAERTSSDDLPLIEDCKYGDSIKIESVDGASFVEYEIAIIGKQGEITVTHRILYYY